MSKYLEEALKQGLSYEQVVPIKLETYHSILEKIKSEPKPVIVPTSIPTLDSLIGGFQPGRLYVLSAMTKQGKTTMAQTFMHNMGKQNKPSMIFSYEMSAKEVAIVFGEMDKLDNVITELPVYIPTELHRGGGTLQYQWIFEAMAKAKMEKGVTIAIIDHLHFLLPLKDYNNTSFVIGGIVRELKRIATVLEMTILLIAHVGMVKDDKVPDWTDIRDSSFITQEADLIMMMYRIKDKEAARKQTDESTVNIYKNKTILSVELNRMGGQTGKIKLRHNGAKFIELTEIDSFMESYEKSL